MQRVLAPALWVVATIAASVVVARAQTPFRSGVQMVAVYATVHDSAGRLIPGLPQEAFQVLDDGKPAQILTFSNDIVPITTVLMLDMSSSVMPEFFRIREAALHFVDVLLPADRARVGSFSDEVAVSPMLTSNHAVLRRVLNEELWTGNATALWSGIRTAMDALNSESGRRVVLVLTDGDDFCELRVNRDLELGPAQRKLADAQRPKGCTNFNAVRDQAQAGEFMIYAIGMESAGLSPMMADLTSATGGGHFILARNADLPATFDSVANELHHQYLIGIQPARDGKTHSLVVKMTRPGLGARARKSYQAPTK